MKNPLALAALVLGTLALDSRADLVWTDWTSFNASTNVAAGTITVEGQAISVNYVGDVSGGSTGGGTNYWRTAAGPREAYDGLDGAPVTADHIQTTLAGTKTLTFSQALLNPVLAIISVGQPRLPITYTFNQPFTILDEGRGYWGIDGNGAQVSGNSFVGNEWHGAIQFSGAVTSISWTTNPHENWHGFTVGVDENLPAAVPEPGTLGLMGLGLAGLAFAIRRRKAKA